MLLAQLLVCLVATNPLPNRDVGYCDIIDHNTVLHYNYTTKKYDVKLEQLVAIEDDWAVDYVHFREFKEVHKLAEKRYLTILHNGRFVISKEFNDSFTDFDLEVKYKGNSLPVFSRWHYPAQ